MYIKNVDYGRQEGRKSQSSEGLQSEGLFPIGEERRKTIIQKKRQSGRGVKGPRSVVIGRQVPGCIVWIGGRFSKA